MTFGSRRGWESFATIERPRWQTCQSQKTPDPFERPPLPNASPMNTLFGLLAAPTAATAVNAVGQTAKAAAAPFEMLLKAAMSVNESGATSDESQEADDDAGSLQDQVARQLQQLLQSLGVAAGERVSINVDTASGDITVDDAHPLAAAIEEALRSDSQLEADVRRLAEINGLFDNSPFVNESELRIEVAEDQAAALLEWR